MDNLNESEKLVAKVSYDVDHDMIMGFQDIFVEEETFS